MKRSAMPPRRTPLDRRSALRRVALIRTVELARSASPRRRKTTRGEFSPRAKRLMWGRWDGGCIVCGRRLPPKGWTPQHRRARGMGGSGDPVTVSPANGLAVHELPCHRRIEENPLWALVMGYRVPQHGDPVGTAVRGWDGKTYRLTSDGRAVLLRAEESA
jgi:hypothetical protein